MKPFPTLKGVKFYLCGGAVRDIFLGHAPKDRDFIMITDLSLDDIADRLVASGYIIYQIRPEFQTILCRKDHENVDLSLPRKECKYSDLRHPDSTERVKDLESDSTRRDFTINAMYMNEDGNVYDFHGGTQDIGAKIIRCVGSPRERFKEDPIRILRAIRLAVTLGFDIHDDTFDEMIFHRMLLLSPSLSLDRMKNEINRALAVNPHRTLELLDSIDFFTIAKLRDENFRIELVNRK